MSLTNFSLEQFLNLKKKILRKINAISSRKGSEVSG